MRSCVSKVRETVSVLRVSHCLHKEIYYCLLIRTLLLPWWYGSWTKGALDVVVDVTESKCDRSLTSHRPLRERLARLRLLPPIRCSVSKERTPALETIKAAYHTIIDSSLFLFLVRINQPLNSRKMASGTTACQGEKVAGLETASLVTPEERKMPLLDLHQEIKILGEVVGAYGLIRDETDAELDSDDQTMLPYAVVKYGDSTVLQTKDSVEPGRNPTWTISSGSIFLLPTTLHKLMKTSLEISIYFDRKDALNISTIEKVFLGRAVVDCGGILANCQEERLVVELKDEFEDSGLESRGQLTLRFRLGAKKDEQFLQKMAHCRVLRHQSSLTGLYDAFHIGTHSSSDDNETMQSSSRPTAFLPTEVDETEVAGTSFVNALSSAFTSKSYYDKNAGAQKIRVKPHPDPDRVEETSYMSAAEIRRETMAPSKEWVEAGSGKLGKLYLEILRCSGLPNVDVGETVGNLTDAFICAVYEDAMVQTPVIDDELSPHWLPWTQRAFVFGMMHPASMLYLGCFDYDLGPLTEHEAIGRVAVNISNLQRDTDYTLQYDLYPSSNVTERKPNGSITIRLRVTYNDERAAVIAALKPRPKFHVNVRREKSQKVVHYTCFGAHGDESEEKFDLTVTRSYINEIFEHKRNVSYAIGDGLRSLIFWRGQVRLFGIMLPLYSFLFFCAANTVIERPYMFPSFFLLTVAWIMMATGTQRQQHPSPWYRCPSFWQYVNVLKTGRSPLQVRRIASKEGFRATQEYEAAWSDRVAKDLDEAARKAEMKKQLDELGNQKIQTKMVADNVIPIELLGRLARYQGIIGRYCRYFRFMKIILTWEESIVSFWITACFLVAGLVSLVLPWAFILTWLSRIVVWCFLGPHMKIVDAYLLNSRGEDKVLQQAVAKFNQQSFRARARHQDALKLKDMKCLRFGQYLTLVPSFNLARYYDRPLATSHARLHKEVPVQISAHRILGQQLFGDIIPRTQEEDEAFAEEREQLNVLLARLLQTVKVHHDEETEPDETSFSSNSDMPSTTQYETSGRVMTSKIDETTADESNRPLGPVSSSNTLMDETEMIGSLSLQDSLLQIGYTFGEDDSGFEVIISQVEVKVEDQNSTTNTSQEDNSQVDYMVNDQAIIVTTSQDDLDQLESMAEGQITAIASQEILVPLESKMDDLVIETTASLEPQ